MALRLNTPLPPLSGATAWLHGEPETAGGPVLVYFWSVSCHICHENMPRIAAWRAAYGPRGLRLVAIHVPRAEAETDAERVRAAAAEFGITDPLGLDNRHAVLQAFDNTFLPAYFLFDAEGKLRSRAAGDAGLGLMDAALEKLFGEEGR